MTDRRTFLTAALAAPIVAAAPALAASPDPVDAYRAACDAYNEDRISEATYLAAVERVDKWQAPTCRDFVRQFLTAFDGGHPNRENMELLRQNAKRLTAKGA